jgi:hypothetical protein
MGMARWPYDKSAQGLAATNSRPLSGLTPTPRPIRQGGIADLPSMAPDPHQPEPPMNPSPFKTSTALRLGSLLAAGTVTVVLLGSQLGIADGYTAQADALLADRHFGAVAQQTAVSAARSSHS